MTEPRVLVGIVGYSPILDGYPLGPLLLRDLEAALAASPHVTVENFTWSPVHIVQRFETGEMARPDRVVLVGAAAVAREPGRVRAFRWRGGQLPEAELQERVYQAVTGIVDLENTLMIGSYFGAWPDACFTVEAALEPDLFGRMVLAESEGWATEQELARHLGYSPMAVRREMVRQATAIATRGAAADLPLLDKAADSLAPLRPFAEHHALKKAALGQETG